MERILVYGQGGHSKVIQMMLSRNKHKKVCLIAEDDTKKTNLLKPVKIVPSHTLVDYELEFDSAIIAIGDNATRKKIVKKNRGMTYTIIIDPSAMVADDVVIGLGTAVMPMSVINPSVRIGEHCIVNTGAIIEHDCVIGEYSHISPGAVLTGGVQIGKSVHIGANTTILPGLIIGDHARIGAGAVVTKNVTANSVMVGNPAREWTKDEE